MDLGWIRHLLALQGSSRAWATLPSSTEIKALTTRLELFSSTSHQDFSCSPEPGGSTSSCALQSASCSELLPTTERQPVPTHCRHQQHCSSSSKQTQPELQLWDSRAHKRTCYQFLTRTVGQHHKVLCRNTAASKSIQMAQGKIQF